MFRPSGPLGTGTKAVSKAGGPYPNRLGELGGAVANSSLFHFKYYLWEIYPGKVC